MLRRSISTQTLKREPRGGKLPDLEAAMNDLIDTPPNMTKFWVSWRLALAWLISIIIVIMLGQVRVSTDAEFTFASLVLLPVLFMSWIGGARHGFLMAMFAAVMWGVADIFSEKVFSAWWVPWANSATRLMTYCLVVYFVAQIRLGFEQVQAHASQDALTGLQNRRAFIEAGEVEVERSKRYAHSMAVVFLDLDNFKQLNDSKGHDAGDAALKATAKALRMALRSNDQIARLGGDEFAILLPEIEYSAAVDAGQKILLVVNRALECFPPVKVSVGVAWFGVADRAFAAMIEAADELMYEAKKSGKNCATSRAYRYGKQSAA